MLVPRCYSLRSRASHTEASYAKYRMFTSTDNNRRLPSTLYKAPSRSGHARRWLATCARPNALLLGYWIIHRFLSPGYVTSFFCAPRTPRVLMHLALAQPRSIEYSHVVCWCYLRVLLQGVTLPGVGSSEPLNIQKTIPNRYAVSLHVQPPEVSTYHCWNVRAHSI